MDFSTPIDYSALEFDYFRITGEEDDRKLDLKHKLHKLSDAEKRVFLVYLEVGSYTGTARIFGVNPNTVKNYINKIKSKL